MSKNKKDEMKQNLGAMFGERKPITPPVAPPSVGIQNEDDTKIRVKSSIYVHKDKLLLIKRYLLDNDIRFFNAFTETIQDYVKNDLPNRGVTNNYIVITKDLINQHILKIPELDLLKKYGKENKQFYKIIVNEIIDKYMREHGIKYFKRKDDV